MSDEPFSPAASASLPQNPAAADTCAAAAVEEDIQRFLSFVHLHEAQLAAIGFPLGLQKRLESKVRQGIFDAGERFILVPKAGQEAGGADADVDAEEGHHVFAAYELHLKADGKPMLEGEDVFLIDHIWTTTAARAKTDLQEHPELVDKLLELFGYEFHPPRPKPEPKVEPEPVPAAATNAVAVEATPEMEEDPQVDLVMASSGMKSKWLAWKVFLEFDEDVILSISECEKLVMEGKDVDPPISERCTRKSLALAEEKARKEAEEEKRPMFKGLKGGFFSGKKKKKQKRVAKKKLSKLDVLYEHLKKHAYTYSVLQPAAAPSEAEESSGAKTTEYVYVMDIVGNAIPATDSADTASCEIKTFILLSQTQASTFSILWPLRQIEPGERITRPHLVPATLE